MDKWTGRDLEAFRQFDAGTGWEEEATKRKTFQKDIDLGGNLSEAQCGLVGVRFLSRRACVSL